MNYVTLVLALLKGAPFGLGDFATKLEADLAAGKISADEIPGLVEAIAPAAEQFFPKNAPEIGLAVDIAAAVDKYIALKKAAAPTPATAAPKA